MLYLFYGTDIHTARAKLHTTLSGLLEKRPDAEYFHITDENVGTHSLEELISSQGLFEQKYVVVLDRLFENSDTKELLLSLIKEMAQSEHVFLVLEGKLDKKTVGTFEKHAKKVAEYGIAEKKKERFNTFSLTDAFGERDRKKLWMLYQEAKLSNIADEEIHGILFWQVKSMLLSLHSQNAKEAGLNPFVYNKSKRFIQKYTKEELEKKARALISLSHDARRGIHEFDVALERFILSV